ncbi:MAG: glycosyltransferase family 39 protein [Bacteroidetes bacterium]|nr:glycosyltransferase family 39 protein [Bacteroidota bacterium]
MTSLVNPNKIYGIIKKSWNDQPLVIIMVLAILFRLLAAIFAKGWGMLDDHFLVIEAPQSWVYGKDYNSWLPGGQNNVGPTGHNFFYPGINFLLFTLMKWMYIGDPQVKMLIVRILHGAFSLITVYYGYRIVETLSDKKSARLAGILLALYFFMPWISVRNLVESVSIPFLMLGFWQIINPRKTSGPFRLWLLTGILFGLATDVRYQSVLFPVGVFIIILFERKWKEVAGMATGMFCSFLLVQTTIDVSIWGYPFAEFLGYIKVNITDRNSYFNLPWYNYFITVGGILLPPVSIFLLYGYIRGWKRYFLLFFPSALFFAFHSFYPNKQERFILPFVPFLIMLGTMGYYQYIVPSGFWSQRKKLLRACWIFFWVINILLLSGLTFMYSKRAQVESMYYLSRYPYVANYIIEDADGNVPMSPIFYTGKWPWHPEKTPTDTTIYQRVTAIAAQPKFYHPQFFLFTGDRNLSNRVAAAKKSFPLLVYETTIEPGFIDKLMHRLNPVNKANNIYIYRNRDFYKSKIESVN